MRVAVGRRKTARSTHVLRAVPGRTPVSPLDRAGCARRHPVGVVARPMPTPRTPRTRATTPMMEIACPSAIPSPSVTMPVRNIAAAKMHQKFDLFSVLHSMMSDLCPGTDPPGKYPGLLCIGPRQPGTTVTPAAPAATTDLKGPCNNYSNTGERLVEMMRVHY